MEATMITLYQLMLTSRPYRFRDNCPQQLHIDQFWSDWTEEGPSNIHFSFENRNFKFPGMRCRCKGQWSRRRMSVYTCVTSRIVKYGPNFSEWQQWSLPGEKNEVSISSYHPNSPKGRIYTKLLFGQIFQNTAWKWKKWYGGCASLSPPWIRQWKVYDIN